MRDKFLRLALMIAIFALVAGLAHYARNAPFYPFVVVDAADGLTLTFLQQPSADGEACAALAATIGSLMRANCATCNVTRQECLRDLSPDLRDLFSEKPIATPSAHIRNGVISYAHPNPEAALAACMESQRQAAVKGHGVQVICAPPGTPRPLHRKHSLLIESTEAGFGYLVHAVAVLAAGLALFLVVRIFSVRSPTDAVGVSSTADIDFKISNLVKRVIDVMTSVIVLTLLFPIVMLISALLFVMEGYPIFYVSRRYISLHDSVTILKFRTMVKDANSPKYRLQERFMRDGYLDIPLSCEVYTPLGRILERTQLVEILQLFNILFHGMSLIGNRPLPRGNIKLLSHFEGWEGRFASPAGLTGLSQVVGKLNQSPQQRLELECLYSNVYRSKSGNICLCDTLIAYYTIRFLLFGKPLSIEGARRLVTIASGK